MSSISQYNIDTALSLLSPADFGISSPKGCLDHLSLIIHHLAIFVLRVFNLACGDQHWYDNQTARHIVELYSATPEPNTFLDEQIRQLYNALLLRAHGNVSWAAGINTNFLHYHNNAIHTELRLIEEIPLDFPPISLEDEIVCEEPLASPFPVPPEILIKEILPRCGESLMQLLATCKSLKNSIQGERKLYNNLLVQLALKKALALASRQNEMDTISLLCEFAKIQACTNPEQAKKLLQDAIELSNTLSDPDEPTSSFIVYNSKSRGLYLAASAAVLVDPEMAIGIAHQIPVQFYKNYALARIAKEQTLKNIDEAIAIVKTMDSDVNPGPLNSLNAIIVKFILKVQALAAPEQALNHAKQLMPNTSDAVIHKDDLLLTIAQQKAFTNLTEAREITSSIPEYIVQAIAYEPIAVALAISNPEEALNMADQIYSLITKHRTLIQIAAKQAAAMNLETALATVDLIEGDSQGQVGLARTIALCAIAHQIVSTHPSQADAFCRTALALTSQSTDEVAAEESTHSIRRKYNTGKALYEIVSVQVLINLDQARATAHLIQDCGWKAKALCKIASQSPPSQANSLYLSAIEIAQSADSICPDQDALHAIVKAQARTNIEEAERTANLMFDLTAYHSALNTIVQMQTDIILEEAFAAADLQQDEIAKNRVLTYLASYQALQFFRNTPCEEGFYRGEQYFNDHLSKLNPRPANPALETVSFIQDPLIKERTLREIAVLELSQNFEKEILELENRQFHAPVGIYDDGKGDALCQILQAKAAARPDKKNDLLLHGLSRACLSPDERNQMHTLLKLAQALSES